MEEEVNIPDDIFWSYWFIVPCWTFCFNMESQSIWRAQCFQYTKRKHKFLYHQRKHTGTDKKKCRLLWIFYENWRFLIILESRENVARRAQLLFYARAFHIIHLWRAFVTRFSAVFRAALTEIVRFSRPLSRWEYTVLCFQCVMGTARGADQG